MKIEYTSYSKLSGTTITIKKEDIILDCHMLQYNNKLKIGKLIITDNFKQNYDDLTNWFLIVENSGYTFKINNITFLDSLISHKQIHFSFDSVTPWK